MYSFWKPRPSTRSTFSCLLAPFVTALVITFPSCGQAAELLDRYFFTGDNQGLVAGSNARISGLAGSILELGANGSANLLSGTFTVRTSSQSANLRAGAYEISIPPSSCVTVRNNNGVVVSSNESGTDTGIISSGSVIGRLRSGETYPSGEAQLKPVLTHGGMKDPLFAVGDGELHLSGNSEASLALMSGELFFCPSRSLKIETPLGQVVAGPRTSFLVSVAPGAVRVFNCRSGSLKFHSESKFRNISHAEEFCVFDHRPTKEEVLPSDGIGRKEVTLHDLDKQKVTASTNAFSVVSLLTSPNFLGDWKRTSAFAKKLETNLIKSAAAYGGANPGSESFYRTPAEASRQ